MRCSNLPSPLSTFMGREREIATANRLLNGTRLLTLVGPGGCGKTRLALAVAEGLVRRYPDGVWLVELAPVSDPDLVPQAVVTALDLRVAPGRPPVDALRAYLGPGRLLLLFDNCEHLIDACAKLAHGLLTNSPRLRILATSREPLHVTGETTWTVPPLKVPELRALPPLEELERIAAVRLFVDRARHMVPGFALTEQNAISVSQTCYWLAGSPLAIELAAARIRVLSPEQIAARLENDLGLLATGDRTVPARHRTLQATLDWSYNLLSEDEQALFRLLSVFPGSISVEAAEAVCAPDGFGGTGRRTILEEESEKDGPAALVLELLTGLVEKSLLEVDAVAGPERRFRYLEPVRQYALARLARSADEIDARDRLLMWAVALAEEVGPRTFSSRAKSSVELLEREHPNLRAALEWGLKQPSRAKERHRLAIGLAQFWQVRGYIGEGVAWFEQLLAGLGDVPIPLQIDTLEKAAFLAIHARDFARARRYLVHGIELSEGLADRHGIAHLYHHQGWLSFSEGNLEEADRLCDAALGLYEESDDDWGRATALFLRANIDYLRHDYAGARKSVEASIALCKHIGHAPAWARRQVRLGQICLVEGDHEGAKRCLAEGLRTSRETGDNWGTAMALAGMAGLAKHRGQHERAAWLLGVTQHFRDAFGVPLWEVDEMEYDRNRAELQSRLGDPDFQAVTDRGAQQAARDLDETLRLILEEPGPDETGRRVPGRRTAVRPPAPGEFGPLTRREREVAALVAQGKSNAEIAAALFVGLRTVEAHVTHILNKLGFNSRTQIAAWISRETPASFIDPLDDTRPTP